MLLYNLNVFGEEWEYILIRNGKIEKTGTGNLPDAGKKLNMNNALIYPGFCDAHTHLENVGLMHGTLDLTGKQRDEVLGMVERACETSARVVGRGWDESMWKDAHMLTGEELDAICPQKVVILIREDGHLAVINSRAAEICNVKSENGIIREDALSVCIKKLNLFSTVDLHYAQNYALSKGITCVHDFATLNTFKQYFKMHRRGELKIRVYASFYDDAYKLFRDAGLYSGFGDSFLKIGALKLFADGSIGAGTAATRYANGSTIAPMLDRAHLKEIVNDANAHGIRVFTHAIGDLAIESVIEAYEGTTGNRIEHFEIVRDEFLKDWLSVCAQPNFLKWAKEGGLYHKKLGAESLLINNPYRKMLDSGMNVLFGSDCMPMDPLYGIRLATQSEYPHQRLSVDEAVRAYTLGSRYMASNLGEIKAGYLADLVAVKDDKITMTMVNGKIYNF
ncbi:MAG: amidohydrolase family protein [Euryarchaeota archaeon]|nr:amidohydrolase family protein [Euryarchaeota archaeon]